MPVSKNKFFLDVNPVASFLKSLQRSLDAPVTGQWDVATHNALWSWLVAWDAASTPGGVSDLPAMLPWKQQVCTADGFNPARILPDGTTADCIDTVDVIIGEALESYAEAAPAFVQLLGWLSLEDMNSDEDWLAVKDVFGAGLAEYIHTILGTELPCPEGQARQPDGSCAAAALTCPEGQVQQADGTCGPPPGMLPPGTPPPATPPPAEEVVPWYKKTSTWLLLGGGVAAGLAIWYAMRKKAE